MTARRAAAVLATLAVLLGLAPPAAAHTGLTGATPAPGETVDRLDGLRLTFQDVLAPAATHSVQLLDPLDQRWDTGAVTPAGDREVEVAVLPAVARTGQYLVRWCAVSADGHSQRGAYAFTYDGPTAAASPAGTLDADPPCAAGTAPAAAAPSGGASASATGWVVVAAAGASVLYLAARSVLGARRRRTA